MFTRISVIDARTTAESNEKYSGFVKRVPNSCEFMYMTTAWLLVRTKITIAIRAAIPTLTYLPASRGGGLDWVDELYKIKLPSFVSN